MHFPIALLSAAAVAEVFWMSTSHSLFQSASRFCIWSGAITAVVGTATGWLFGGWHLVDENWILTTHRWLGTTATVLSCAVLAISEWSCRRPNSAPARVYYRVVLFIVAILVGATGYFGGVLIYGLDHYAW